MTDRNWTRAPFSNRAALARQKRVVTRIVEVDDPISAKPRVAAKIMRPSGIEDMHARGRISDRLHAAAKRFEDLYAQADSDGLKAIDYGKVRVDGGRRGGIGTLDATMRAKDDLKTIEMQMEPLAYLVLVLTAGKGLGLGDACKKLPSNDNGKPRSPRTMTAVVTSALEALDAMWADTGAKPSGVRAESYGERATMEGWVGGKAG